MHRHTRKSVLIWETGTGFNVPIENPNSGYFVLLMKDSDFLVKIPQVFRNFTLLFSLHSY